MLHQCIVITFLAICHILSCVTSSKTAIATFMTHEKKQSLLSHHHPLLLYSCLTGYVQHHMSLECLSKHSPTFAQTSLIVLSLYLNEFMCSSSTHHESALGGELSSFQKILLIIHHLRFLIFPIISHV